MSDISAPGDGWIELRKEARTPRPDPAAGVPDVTGDAGPAVENKAPGFEPGRLYRLPPDRLRPDPDQPRRFLVDVARKRQARGMSRAFRTYLEKRDRVDCR